MEENNISLILKYNLYKEYEAQLIKSSQVLDYSRRINLAASLGVILIGFIGNLLVTLVFAQKKFRTNSSHIYLLCSAINDNLFILIHLFEDLLRTIKDIYSHEEEYWMHILNITDKSNFTCKFINYLRNFLRFVSAYIVVAFTLQRLYIVRKPLSLKFKRKKSGWQTVGIIVIVSLCVNIWVPFIFQLSEDESLKSFCDIDKNFKKEYFFLNIFYICFIMLIPMIIILISNFIIIYTNSKVNSKRKHLVSRHSSINSNPKQRRSINTKNSIRINKSDSNKLNIVIQKTAFPTNASDTPNSNIRLKAHYWTFEQVINKNKKSNSSNAYKKMTIMLLVISFSFVALNLPYLIEWCIFFYKAAFHQLDTVSRHYLIAALQISEIFYILNYGLKFFVFCATGSTFRKKLRNISK